MNRITKFAHDILKRRILDFKLEFYITLILNEIYPIQRLLIFLILLKRNLLKFAS